MNHSTKTAPDRISGLVLSLLCCFNDTRLYQIVSSLYQKVLLLYHIMDNEVSPLAMLRRIRGNISQAEVADALGVERNTVTRWETGTSKPKLEPWQVKKLCKLLQITIDELPDNFAPQPIHSSLTQNQN